MRRTARAARIVPLAVLTLLALAGCSTQEVLRFGWPQGVTDKATLMRQLWTGSTLAALAMGVLVWGLIFWCCIVYRRRDNEVPKQTAYNLPLEVVYTIVPFVIIAVLFYFTVVVETDVEAQTANPDVTVEVTGFQWNWEFRYLNGPQDTAGEPISIIGDNQEVAVLVLPVGKTIRFELHSNDVIHSFWVPEFLFKRDVIPGKNFGYDNDFEVTIGQAGAYVGRCAELCGIYHSAMNFEVRAVTADVYDKFLAARMSGQTNADALQSVGEPPLAETTNPFDTNRTRRSATD